MADKIVNREIKILINRKEIEDATSSIKIQMDKVQTSIDNAYNSTEKLNGVYKKIGTNDKEIQKLTIEMQELEREAKLMQKQGINVDETLGRIASKKLGIKLLTEESAGFRKEAQHINADLKELAANESKLEKLTDKWRQMSGVLKGTVEPSLNQIRENINQLTRDINNMPGGGKGSQKLQDLNNAKAAYAKMKSEIDGVAEAEKKMIDASKNNWAKWKDIAMGVIVGNTVEAALSTMTGYITGLLSGNAKLSDSLADVQRVTGLTAEEVKQLNTELGKLDTRTSTAGLRDIAVIAGKLGIAKNDIVEFVKATDKLTVALGDELGNADEITTSMGKLINVFSKDGKVTGDAMMHIGNALVHMANAGVATGGFIVDFTQRLSGLSKMANIALPDVIGFAAGLEELGQKSESSGTAIVKILGKVGEDVPKFAKIAGVSIEEFSKTLREKPLEALIKVSQGLAAGKGSFEEISKSFKDAGEDGARVVSVLGVIGAKADFMRSKISAAGDAMNNTNEITNAFELKNQTLGAELEKMGKTFAKVFQSSTLADFLKSAVHGLEGFLLVLKELPNWLSRNYALIMALSTITLAYYGNIIKTTVATIAQTFAQQQSNIATKASAAWEAIMITYMGTRITLTQLLTGQITIATAAQKIWNLTLAANPIGAVIVLLGALATAMAVAYNNSKQAIEYERLRNEISEAVIKTNNGLAKSQELYNNQIQNYSRLSLLEREDLKKNIDLKLLEAKATMEQLKAKEKLAIKDAARPTAMQFAKNLLLGGASSVDVDALNNIDAAQNAIDAGKEMDDEIKTLEASINNLSSAKLRLTEITNAEGIADKMQAVTQAQLSEKLNFYNTALANAVIGGEDYLRIKKKIAELESKMKVSSNTMSADELKKFQEEYKSFINDVTKLTKSGTQAQLEEVDFRYAELKKRLDKYVKNVGEHHTIEQKLEKEHQAELNKIREDATKKLIDNSLKATEEASIKRMEKELDDVIALDKLDAESSTDTDKVKELLQKEHLQRMIAAYKFFGRDTTHLQKQLQDIEVRQFTTAEQAKIDAAKKANHIIEADEKKLFDNKIKRLNKYIQFAEYGYQGLSELNKVLSNSENVKHENTKKLAQDDIARLDQNLANGLISQKEHDDEIIALNQRLDTEQRKIAHDQAIRQKELAAMQIALDTAKAVMSVASTGGGTHYLDFGVSAATLESIVITLGALQAAAVLSAPVPELEDGGFIKGKRHSEGGVPIIAEDGEVMGSRKFVANNPAMAEAVAQASKYNQGVLPTWWSAPIQTMNYGNTSKGVAYSKYGSVGVSSNSSAFTSHSNTTQSVSNSNNDAFVSELKAMRNEMRNWQTDLKAIVVYQDLNNANDRINKIKKAAKLNN